jgi:hypothetical protein
MAAQPHKSCRPRSTAPAGSGAHIPHSIPSCGVRVRPSREAGAHLRSEAGRGHGRRIRTLENSGSQLRATVTVWGPRSASARPGPCTRPRSADALTRREYHPARQRPASRHPTVVAVKRWPGRPVRPSGRSAGLVESGEPEAGHLLGGLAGGDPGRQRLAGGRGLEQTIAVMAGAHPRVVETGHAVDHGLTVGGGWAKHELAAATGRTGNRRRSVLGPQPTGEPRITADRSGHKIFGDSAGRWA